jgi:hypothetical protein
MELGDMLENNNWITNPKHLRNESKGPDGFGIYYKRPGTDDDKTGYFVFIKSVYDYKFKPEVKEVDEINTPLVERCDVGLKKDIPKPIALHEKDEETGLCNLCGSADPIYTTTNSHVATIQNTRILRLPFQGYSGFIVYLKLDDKSLEEKDSDYSENLARTLQELFRLMLEWEWCYMELGTRDTYSILAYEILKEMDVPSSIRDWLWTEVPDQRVAKFLKGDTNARLRSDPLTIPDMSLEFDSWCWYNIIDKPSLWTHGFR